jgi:hypothetical protein
MNKIQPLEEDKRQFRNIIDQKLSKSGEKERLKEFLRLKLSECGWREEIKHYCKEYISSKGLETVSLDKLIEEITPHARGKHKYSRKTCSVQDLRLFTVLIK